MPLTYHRGNEYMTTKCNSCTSDDLTGDENFCPCCGNNLSINSARRIGADSRSSSGSVEWDKRLLAGISEIIYNANPESVWGIAEDILTWLRSEGVIPPNGGDDRSGVAQPSVNEGGEKCH